MSNDELDRVIRVLGRQRPFHAYRIEFLSGQQLAIVHPEAVVRRTTYYLFIGPDREQQYFTAEAVCRVILPAPAIPA